MSEDRFEPLVRVGERNNFLAVVATARADCSSSPRWSTRA